jgi:hypothetical protein
MPEADGGAQLTGTCGQRSAPQFNGLISTPELHGGRRCNVEIVRIGAHDPRQGRKKSVCFLRLSGLETPHRFCKALRRRLGRYSHLFKPRMVKKRDGCL